jgi:hypothetical protein
MAFGERLNDPGILMEALFLKALTRLYRGDFAGARECSVTAANLALGRLVPHKASFTMLDDVVRHFDRSAGESLCKSIGKAARSLQGRNKAFLVKLICSNTYGDFIGPKASAATQLLGPLPTGRRQARAPGSGPT